MPFENPSSMPLSEFQAACLELWQLRRDEHGKLVPHFLHVPMSGSRLVHWYTGRVWPEPGPGGRVRVNWEVGFRGYAPGEDMQNGARLVEAAIHNAARLQLREGDRAPGPPRVRQLDWHVNSAGQYEADSVLGLFRILTDGRWLLFANSKEECVLHQHDPGTQAELLPAEAATLDVQRWFEARIMQHVVQ